LQQEVTKLHTLGFFAQPPKKVYFEV
jgi:hypothetical protein